MRRRDSPYFVEFWLRGSRRQVGEEQGQKRSFREDDRRVDYTVEPGRIKEEVVLERRPRDDSLVFDVAWHNDLTLLEWSSGYRLLTPQGFTAFDVAPPFARDAEGRLGRATLRVADGKATISVDSEFLDTAVYPVVVDPTLTTGQLLAGRSVEVVGESRALAVVNDAEACPLGLCVLSADRSAGTWVWGQPQVVASQGHGSDVWVDGAASKAYVVGAEGPVGRVWEGTLGPGGWQWSARQFGLVEPGTDQSIVGVARPGGGTRLWVAYWFRELTSLALRVAYSDDGGATWRDILSSTGTVLGVSLAPSSTDGQAILTTLTESTCGDPDPLDPTPPIRNHVTFWRLDVAGDGAVLQTNLVGTLGSGSCARLFGPVRTLTLGGRFYLLFSTQNASGRYVVVDSRPLPWTVGSWSVHGLVAYVEPDGPGSEYELGAHRDRIVAAYLREDTGVPAFKILDGADTWKPPAGRSLASDRAHAVSVSRSGVASSVLSLWEQDVDALTSQVSWGLATVSPDVTAVSPASPANDDAPEILGAAEADSTVKIFTNSGCTSSVAGSASSSMFASPGVSVNVGADSTTTFWATETDAAGNESLCSDSSVTYVEDSTAPETTITSGPSGAVSSTSASFTYASSESPRWQFHCSLDGAAFTDCSRPATDPMTYTGLAQGSHTFQVRAIDQAGNVDPTPATRTWTVDTVAPDAPTMTSTNPASPANNNSPKVLGQAESGSTVTIYENDACATPAENSGTAAAFASPGIQASVDDDSTTTFTASATDAAGNTSACSNPITYIEDSTPPGAPIVQAAAPAGPANDNSPEILGTAETGSTVRVYTNDTCDSADAWPATAASFASPGITVAVGNDSTTTFWATATDVAGNTSVCSSTSVTYVEDSTAPQTAIESGPPDPVNSTAATLEFSSSESPSTFGCSLDGSAFTGCSSPTTYSGLSEGAHTFQVQASDAAGNTDTTPDSRTWTIDVTAPNPPEVTAASPPGPANDNTPEVSGVSESGSTVRLYRDASCATQVGGPGSAATFASSGVTATVDDDAATTIRAAASDAAGNASGCSSTSVHYVEDSTPPTLASLTVSPDPFSPNGDGTKDTTTFSATASDPSAPINWTLTITNSDLNTVRTYTGVGTAIGQQWDGRNGGDVPQADDTYTGTLTVTDAATNSSTSTATVILDTTVAAPTNLSTSPVSPANDNSPKVLGTAEAGSTVQVYTNSACTQTTGSPQSAGTFADPGIGVDPVADNSMTSFYAKATDAAGNVSACSSPVTYVEDSGPPDTTIASGPTGSTMWTTATWTLSSSEPGSTFECSLDGAPFASCSSPHTYSALSEGAHTIGARAVDPSGNTDPTAATRSWTVDASPRPATTTLNVDPAAVTTLAGNGSNATVDGTGTAAAFRDMGGVVVVDGYAYVGTRGAMRRVDVSTGAVTTFSGSSTEGCVYSSDPAVSRHGWIRDMTTDGTHLYFVDSSCDRIVRVSLATGASSAVATVDHGYVTFGPDGFLYAGVNGQVSRIDATNGSASVIATLDTCSYSGLAATGIAADSANLWVSYSCGVGYQSTAGRVKRIPIDDDYAPQTTVYDSFDSIERITSAGDHLYAATVAGGLIVQRFEKSAAPLIPVSVAGSAGIGYADGTGTDAWFNNVEGLVSDGASLWIADSENYRLRKAVDATPLPAAQPPPYTQTVSLPEAAVTTFAGSGTNTTVDGYGVEASFGTMNGVAVVGSHLYVGTYGHVRKVDLVTGEVTVFAGDGPGCIDSVEPSAARFGQIQDVTTDGYYLYLADSCSSLIRRVSLATGATSSVISTYPDTSKVAFGPDGLLYVAAGGSLLKVDPVNRTATTLGFVPACHANGQMYAQGLAADNDSVWFSARCDAPSFDAYTIRRFPIDGGMATDLFTSGSPLGRITSAGDYLYGVYASSALFRIHKVTAAMDWQIAGGSAGYVDGLGLEARFDDIQGLASDGQMLWIADRNNYRLRVSADLGLLVAKADAFGLDEYGGWGQDINAAVGNFLTSATDFQIAAAGPDLTLTRSYNSLDTKVGALGRGWTHNFEMIARPAPPGAVTVLFPDGRREIHVRQLNGTYTPPAGYFSTLTDNPSGGWTLRTKDTTRYSFNGAGKLTSITDAAGRSLTLAYDGDGHLQTVQDTASGRTLNFTWTGGFISQVATDAVAANGNAPYAFGYYYTGNTLTKACDPRDNTQTGRCTAYTYTSGRISLVTTPRGTTDVEVAYLSDGKVDWRKDGSGNQTDITYLAPGQVAVADPRGNPTTHLYDTKFRVTQETDPEGKTTTYTHDAAGNRSLVTDPLGKTTTMTYDPRGNLLSSTDPAGKTEWMTYDNDDNLITARDERSSGPSDNTFKTTYTYDAAGNRLSETLPASAAYPSGVTRQWAYTSGSEPAVGGGTMPPGLLKQATDAEGAVTSYAYDAKGDLRTITEPSGLQHEFTYDELGRKLTQTHVSDTYPAGVTWTWTHDQLSNVLTLTEPALTNAISNATHQKQTTNTYDANANLTQVTEGDLLGSDPARTTTFTYDNNDRQTSITDPEGRVMSREYDAAGNVIRVTDAEGRVSETSYDTRNRPTSVVLKDFIDDPVTPGTPRDITRATLTYDDVGRRTSDTDALGRVRQYNYDEVDRLTEARLKDFQNRDATLRDIVLAASTYDAAGNAVTETSGNGLRQITHTYDQMGRRTQSILDPNGLNRITSYAYDREGRLTRQTVTQGASSEETRYGHDTAGRLISQTVENGSQDLTTTYSYDQRGVRTAVVAPNGNITGADPADHRSDLEADELGRPTTQIDPPVAVSAYGQADAVTRPENLTGYDTYGNATHSRDPRTNTTTRGYDKLGRLTQITHPTYTNPDNQTITPTEAFQYDKVGNLTRHTNRRGHATDYLFDRLNRVVQQQDPLVTGEAARGTIRYTYDDAGNQTSLVDQTGARTEQTYDKLNRIRTQTLIVRQDANQARLTTFDYTDLNAPTFEQNPAGDTTTWTYNAASEPQTMVDAASKTWTYQHDLASRPTRHTDPLGRATVYDRDQAGRVTAERRHSPQGATLQTTGFGYDANGNQTRITSPRGFDTTYTFDARNQLTQVIEPVSATESITATAGYDAGGNLTRITDGRGIQTWQTLQPWNQPESRIEPATTAHPDLSDRAYTTVYDAGGLPNQNRQPGGVTLTRTFDELGRPTNETGSGGGATTTQRTFGYDLAGRRTQASHPTGTQTFTYDDADQIRTASGPAGNSTYSYDIAGRLTTRTDPPGSHTYTWTSRDELATATDPLTSVARSYGYDDANQLTAITYGQNGPQRTYAYDEIGRLTSDVLRNSAGQEQAHQNYGYNADSNLTSQDLSHPSNPANGTHSYDYDRAGRLTSWTKPDATTLSYGYDQAGNRTAAGSDTYSYDERNRLTQAPDGTYAWSARGTLQSRTDGPATRTFTFDALDRLTNVLDTGSGTANVAYSYDALDRIATRNATPYSYHGVARDSVSDGTFTYAWDPDGQLAALDGAGDPLLAGANRHGDLTQLFNTQATITDSRVYEPFGQISGSVGATNPLVGFQSDQTDPATGAVWMGARWYQPNLANFLSRDTVGGPLANPISLNRYTYSFADPLDYFDPDGNWPKFIEKAASGVGRVGRAFVGGVRGAAKTAYSIGATTGRTIKSAATAGVRIVQVQARRVQHKAASTLRKTSDTIARASRTVAAKTANLSVAGARLGDLTASIASRETLLDAGRSFSNFSAGFIDSATSAATLGHWSTDIGPIYEQDHLLGAYRIGQVTGQVETFLAGGVALKALKGVSVAQAVGATRGATAIQSSRAVGVAARGFGSAVYEAAQADSDPRSILFAGVTGGVTRLAPTRLAAAAHAPRGPPGGARDIRSAADEVSKIVGRNRVSIRTPSGRLQVDLRGAEHVEKSVGRTVPTPHVKFDEFHTNPLDPSLVNVRRGAVRDASWADLRIVRKYLSRIGEL